MSELELKIKIGDAFLELKGSKEDVNEMYDKLNSSFLTQASEQIINKKVEPLQITSDNVMVVDNENKDFTLTQLKLKLSGLNEKDWLLIYAYFYTDRGNKEVTFNDFKEFYFSERKSQSAKSNFSNNLKASANFINIISDQTFTINASGIDRVVGIAKNEIKNNSKKSSSNSTLKTTKKQKQQKFNKISLNLPDEQQFVNSFKAIKSTSITDKIYILLKLYKDYTNIEEFSIDLIHSLLNLVSLDTPSSLVAMMNNFVNRDKTFDRVDVGIYKFKYKGLDKVDEIINNQ